MSKKSILGGEFFYVEGQKSLVQCKRCKKTFKYHHSTSSLKYHLTNYHGSSVTLSKSGSSSSTTTRAIGSDEHSNLNNSSGTATTTSVEQQSQSFVQQTLSGMGHSKITAKKASDMTLSMAMWLAKSCRPIALCEDEGLRDLLRIASGNAAYDPPSRQTIQRRVDNLFQECKTGVESKLANTLHVALTCDYWTSVSNVSFLGMTAHYIEDFKLVSTALAVDESNERHTAQNVRQHIERVVEEYKLDGKVCVSSSTHFGLLSIFCFYLNYSHLILFCLSQVVAVVTDNAPNMLAAMGGSAMVGIGCSAHLLQIAIKHAMEASNTSNLMGKSRKIVGHVKHSAANLRELKQEMSNQGETEESLVS